MYLRNPFRVEIETDPIPRVERKKHRSTLGFEPLPRWGRMQTALTYSKSWEAKN
jgi:hypothetical protein